MLKRGIDKELNMFELFTCRNQGALFSDCQYLDYYPCDAYDFITKFMYSDIAESMDKEVSMCHTWGTEQLYETLFFQQEYKKFGGVFIDDRVLYWVGYLYRYWAWWIGESSKDIIRIIPVERACQTYIGLHTLSPEEAIMMWKNR